MDIVLGGTNKATPRHNYQVLFYCMNACSTCVLTTCTSR